MVSLLTTYTTRRQFDIQSIILLGTNSVSIDRCSRTCCWIYVDITCQVQLGVVSNIVGCFNVKGVVSILLDCFLICINNLGRNNSIDVTTFVLVECKSFETNRVERGVTEVGVRVGDRHVTTTFHQEVIVETNSEDRDALDEGVIRSTNVEVSPIILPICITLGVIRNRSESISQGCLIPSVSESVIADECTVVLLQRNTRVLCNNHRLESSCLGSICPHTTLTPGGSDGTVEDVWRCRLNRVNLCLNHCTGAETISGGVSCTRNQSQTSSGDRNNVFKDFRVVIINAFNLEGSVNLIRQTTIDNSDVLTFEVSVLNLGGDSESRS